MSQSPVPTDDLSAWLAAEAAQSARYEAGVGPGVAPRERVAAMDGLALMRP